MARFINGKLSRNKDRNFFHKIDITSTNFSDNTVQWDFTSQGFSLIVESTNTTDVIQYSFDGTNVHGDMIPGFSGIIIWDDRRENKIWFRRASTGISVRVRIEAWRNDY